MWDERFALPGYAYGTEPNDFLRDVADRLPEGPILCLAEGEGRNAVFLAGRGHPVTAVDQSGVGLAKARELAARRGVTLETVRADLNDHTIAPGAWAGIVLMWCHLPSPLRARVHRAAVAGLRPGGALVLEAYTPRQLEYGTGGPTVVERLHDLEALREDFAGLDFAIAREITREVHEGAFHDGPSAVVQVLGFKR